MTFAPRPARQLDGRAREKAGVSVAENETRRRRSAPAAPAPDVLAPDGSASIDNQLGLLWNSLQRQMLELLTQGIAAPPQKRAFDRLDYAMKQYGKLRRERAEDLRGAKPEEPDADEIAAILDKMDRRIDALAQERFKKLAQGKLHAPGTDGGSAAMDV